MTNVRTIHVDWYGQRPSCFHGGPQLAYQGDHLSNMVVFDHAPGLPNYYLLVEMKTDDTGPVVALPEIQLEGPYWIIPNYYTQICQQITYQVCCKTGTGDYEHHSAKFKGTILPTLKHEGKPIDWSPMFDPYIDILDKRVDELIVAAGDIQIDSELKSDSTNPVQNKVVKAAIAGLGEEVAGVNGRLADELTELKSSLINGSTSPTYYYTFSDYLSGVTSWIAYSTDYFTVGYDYVTVSSDNTQVFSYKRNLFDYSDGDDIIVKILVRIDEYTGTSYGQTLRFLASGYTSSAVTADVYCVAGGESVTYNESTYAVGDTIEVTLTLSSVATSTSEYIGFNNRVNTNSVTPTFTILGFEAYNTGSSETVKVMYAQYADSLSKARYGGRTWCAVGDSLTATYYNVYVDYIANALGLTATNYGIGGTTIAHIDGEDDAMVDRICGLNGYDAYTDVVDLWTVFGGINDAYSGVDIGTIDDADETTFYGALNLICQYLLQLDNHPTIALIAPWDCKSVDETSYCEAIVAIGAKYGLPVLDLSAVSGINAYNWSYYLRDVCHPNQYGVDKIRPVMLEWFERLRLSETTPNMPL